MEEQEEEEMTDQQIGFPKNNRIVSPVSSSCGERVTDCREAPAEKRLFCSGCAVVGCVSSIGAEVDMTFRRFAPFSLWQLQI